MAARRDAKDRAFSSRTLSAAVDALPGEHPSVSHAAIAKLAKGSHDNPTVGTILALCEALGGVPPAHLLPHVPYGNLKALEAFEDPQLRQVLVLLNGVPPDEVKNLITDLKQRRDDLGLEPVPDDEADKSPDKPQRRRSMDDAARYAADALEGL